MRGEKRIGSLKCFFCEGRKKVVGKGSTQIFQKETLVQFPDRHQKKGARMQQKVAWTGSFWFDLVSFPSLRSVGKRLDDDKLIIQDVRTAQPVTTESFLTNGREPKKQARACMWEQWWARHVWSKSCTWSQEELCRQGNISLEWRSRGFKLVFSWNVGTRHVEYEGALQLQTKCNLLKACKIRARESSARAKKSMHVVLDATLYNQKMPQWPGCRNEITVFYWSREMSSGCFWWRIQPVKHQRERVVTKTQNNDVCCGVRWFVSA